jgi:hypothetical protein
VISALLILTLQAGGSASKPRPVAVVVSSKRSGAEAFSVKIAQRVFSALGKAGIPDVQDEPRTSKQLKDAGLADSRNCQGGKSCLTKLAIALGSKAVVVSVDVGKVARQLAVHLEALSAEGGLPLAEADFTAQTDNLNDLSGPPIAAFARELAAKMKAETDAPVLAKLDPVDLSATEPAAVSVATQQQPLPVVSIAFGAGALASMGAAVAFGLLGLDDKNSFTQARYDIDGVVASHLSQSEMDALASRGNMRLTLSLTTAVIGVCLAAASTYFLVRD